MFLNKQLDYTLRVYVSFSSEEFTIWLKRYKKCV